MDRHHKHEKWVSGKPLTILRGYAFEEKNLLKFYEGTKILLHVYKKIYIIFIIKEKRQQLKR